MNSKFNIHSKVLKLVIIICLFTACGGLFSPLYAADVEIDLNSIDGSTDFEIRDSAGTAHFSVDSDGNVAWPQGASESDLTVPTIASSPDTAVTAAEGSIAYDTIGNTLYVNTDGNTNWEALADGGGGGSAIVAGTNTQIQYNSSGSFGAEAGFAYNASTDTMTASNATFQTIILSTSTQLPSAADPTTDTEGEIAYDSDDEALEVYDGSASRLITTTHLFSVTIYDPDSIQSTEDAIAIIPVEADWAPHGIKLISVGIKTDQSSTYSVDFEEWTSPSDGAPSAIETVTTSATLEAEDDGTLTDSDIAVGSIIYVDLPATDIDVLTVWGAYYVKEGD